MDKISSNNVLNYKMAKSFLQFRIVVKNNIKDFILIAIGIFAAAFGFKGFLLTNNFIDGGATGISLLISALTGTPLYIWIICVNIPFIILANKIIDRKFAFKMTLAISGLALVLATVTFPNVTNDSWSRNRIVDQRWSCTRWDGSACNLPEPEIRNHYW